MFDWRSILRRNRLKRSIHLIPEIRYIKRNSIECFVFIDQKLYVCEAISDLKKLIENSSESVVNPEQQQHCNQQDPDHVGPFRGSCGSQASTVYRDWGRLQRKAA